MEPAMDCTVDKTKKTASKVNVIHKSVPVDKDTNGVPITNSAGEPYKPSITKDVSTSLFFVGGLAKAAGCSIYAVQHFLRKKKIRHTRRVANYRQFDNEVLKQLRQYRDEIDKRKAEIDFAKEQMRA